MMTTWSREEEVAFECAREMILHLIAIQTRQITEEARKATPDARLLARLQAERSVLVGQRAALAIDNLPEIARLCADCIKTIRLPG